MAIVRKNINTDYAANADAQFIVAGTVSITSASNVLTVLEANFVVGDIGKAIRIPGAGAFVSGLMSEPLNTTITAVNSTTEIELNNNAATTLSAVTANVVYGTDDSTAFDTWLAAMLLESRDDLIILDCPGPGYLLPNGHNFLHGPRRVIINCRGATFSTIRMGSLSGFSQSANTAGYLEAVAAGALTNRLNESVDDAIFSVGDWCCIAGNGSLQGPFGYPPNHRASQFVQLTAFDAGARQWTISEPARERFRTDFPIVDSGGDYFIGGPVALFKMLPSASQIIGGAVEYGFDLDVTWNGPKVVNCDGDGNSNGGDQCYCQGLYWTCNYGEFIDCAPIPSMNKRWVLNYPIMGAADQIEVDKQVEHVIIRGGTVRRIHVQSSSVHTLEVINPNITLSWTGTALRNFIRGTGTIAELKVGTDGYGATEFVYKDAGVTVVAFDSISINADVLNADEYTNTDGVLTIDPAQILEGSIHYGIEGGYLFMKAVSRSFGRVLSRISSIAVNGGDATKTDFVTTLPAPLPTLPAEIGGFDNLIQHPCPTLLFQSGDTTSVIAARSHADGKPRPLWSRYDHTSAFETQRDTTPAIQSLWGPISRVEIEVIDADVGGNGSSTLKLTRFNNLQVLDAGLAYSTIAPVINAKLAGVRTWTADGGLSGGQSGDSFMAADSLSLVESINPQLDEDISGYVPGDKPSIRLTIETDQGIRPSYLLAA